MKPTWLYRFICVMGGCFASCVLGGLLQCLCVCMCVCVCVSVCVCVCVCMLNPTV